MYIYVYIYIYTYVVTQKLSQTVHQNKLVPKYFVLMENQNGIQNGIHNIALKYKKSRTVNKKKGP